MEEKASRHEGSSDCKWVLVTMAWCLLRLSMEKDVSIYARQR